MHKIEAIEFPSEFHCLFPLLVSQVFVCRLAREKHIFAFRVFPFPFLTAPFTRFFFYGARAAFPGVRSTVSKKRENTTCGTGGIKNSKLVSTSYKAISP